jgi:hypothetical protein
MSVLNTLRAWGDSPAFILSCPGPLRRHTASFTPVSQLALPQCLLGYEAQVSAFVAASPELAARTVFTPLPEIFSTPESLAPLAQLLRASPHAGRKPVHLRFGSTRTARVMKPARNGAVVAEDHRSVAITTSQHPFGSGLTLPAGIRRIFTYTAELAPLRGSGGGLIPATVLPAAFVTADLTDDALAPDQKTDITGLEIVSLAEFRSAPWANSPTRARSPDWKAAQRAQAADGAPFVLIPWNLDHPGSIVPDFLIRLTKLQSLERPAVRMLLMPFNYPGQLGLIRRMIARVRNSADMPEALLASIFLGRLSQISALPTLRRIGCVAWVDGNDAEHAWTCRRLSAGGIQPILLHPDESGMAGTDMWVPAHETIWVDADTRWGQLHFASRMPTIRTLPALLTMTQAAAKPLVTGTSAARPSRQRRLAIRRAAG